MSALADEDDQHFEPRIVYLVRHGRTALNAEGRLRGLMDPPLDDAGWAQVLQLGSAFASLDRAPCRVVSGPLLRTRQTAGAIAEALGLEVHTDRRLIDRDYGPWNGELAAPLRQRFGTDLADLPDAEPLDEVIERARQALEAQDRYLKRPVVLVAHDAVNTHLLAAIDPTLGSAATIVQDNACWNRLEQQSPGWRVSHVNGSALSLLAIRW